MTSLTRFLGAALVALAVSISTAPAHAQSADRASGYNLDDGLALQGYDPVAYFPEGGGEATKGKASITHTHAGVTYRFASDANRARFVKAPATYEPAYGGWCAWAMSEGYQAEIDPESFRVYRGRLFVFYKALFADTRSKWLKDEPARMERADASWKKLSGEEPPALARDTSLQNLGDGALAIQGYDPVSYFPEGGGTPEKGSERHGLVHDGIAYRFASAENKAAFERDPGKYEPVYGGWCAYAIADGGSFVEIDPESYVIRDDGLHLFYDGWLGDTRALWLEDDAGYAAKAERQWDTIVETGKRP